VAVACADICAACFLGTSLACVVALSIHYVRLYESRFTGSNSADVTRKTLRGCSDIKIVRIY
jgi:hypothetical protein